MSYEFHNPEWLADEKVERLTLRRAMQKTEDNISLAADLFRENAPIAAMSICHLAIHSPAEQIRLAAAKHVVDRAMGTPISSKGTEAAKPVWENLFEDVKVGGDDDLPN